MGDLLKFRKEPRHFAAERDFDQVHSPKNLAIALSVEAAELLEPFQWLTEEASTALPPAKRAQVEEEMADVLLYLIRLAAHSMGGGRSLCKHWECVRFVVERSRRAALAKDHIGARVQVVRGVSNGYALSILYLAA
jgi:NTP pyrophosphatase (non-canonical NTP hydrolase)